MNNVYIGLCRSNEVERKEVETPFKRMVVASSGGSRRSLPLESMGHRVLSIKAHASLVAGNLSIKDRLGLGLVCRATCLALLDKQHKRVSEMMPECIQHAIYEYLPETPEWVSLPNEYFLPWEVRYKARKDFHSELVDYNRTLHNCRPVIRSVLLDHSFERLAALSSMDDGNEVSALGLLEDIPKREDLPDAPMTCRRGLQRCIEEFQDPNLHGVMYNVVWVVLMFVSMFMAIRLSATLD